MTADQPQPDPHHFEFDLDRGIKEQLIEKLENSPALPLVKGVGPKLSGVYALYFDGELVYAGKASKGTTKSERTLRARFAEHFGKLTKYNVPMDKVTCRYLTVESEWWVFACEFALITFYQPKWNGSGYGSKTPGKGRPGTDRVSAWDKMFPGGD